MTELQGHQNTKYSAKKRQKRSAYLEQKREVTRSKLRSYLSQEGALRAAFKVTDVTSSKGKYLFKCRCGREFFARVNDVLRTNQKHCNPCSRSKVMQAKADSPEWGAHQKRMTNAAAKANKKDAIYVSVRRRCNNAKARCTCPTNKVYKYYGGRGVEFRFKSPVAMAEWVLENLGPPPASMMSLDRKDNNGHYEPGNLRWATPRVQGNNKREYSTGERSRRLSALRPDYHIGTIRMLIADGLTDEEIINRKKWGGCGEYIRHT